MRPGAVCKACQPPVGLLSGSLLMSTGGVYSESFSQVAAVSSHNFQLFCDRSFSCRPFCCAIPVVVVNKRAIIIQIGTIRLISMYVRCLFQNYFIWIMR